MSITAGGALSGLLLATVIVVSWWRKSGAGAKTAGPPGGGESKRSYKGLLPFVLSFCLGLVISLGVHGILGTAASGVRTGGNQAGDDALSLATGAKSFTVSHPAQAPLQATEAIFVLVCVTVFVLIWRKAGKGDKGRQLRRDMGCGSITGIVLGPAAAMTALYTAVLLPIVQYSGAHLMMWM